MKANIPHTAPPPRNARQASRSGAAATSHPHHENTPANPALRNSPIFSAHLSNAGWKAAALHPSTKKATAKIPAKTTTGPAAKPTLCATTLATKTNANKIPGS
jgi:hypothetical protein